MIDKHEEIQSMTHVYTFHLICPYMYEHKISHLMTMDDAAELFEQMVNDGMPFVYVEQDGEYRTFYRNDGAFTFH
jgi:hypothetical protein